MARAIEQPYSGPSSASSSSTRVPLRLRAKPTGFVASRPTLAVSAIARRTREASLPGRAAWPSVVRHRREVGSHASCRQFTRRQRRLQRRGWSLRSRRFAQRRYQKCTLSQATGRTAGSLPPQACMRLNNDDTSMHCAYPTASCFVSHNIPYFERVLSY